MSGDIKPYNIVKETARTITFKDDKSFAHKIEQKVSNFHFWGDTKDDCKDYVIAYWEGKINGLDRRKKEIYSIIDKIKNL